MLYQLTMRTFLEFEKPIADMEGHIEELRRQHPSKENAAEIKRLEEKIQRTLQQITEKLTPHQKVQLARHPERPRFLQYTEKLFDDFTPLAGDRLFADDHALIGGPARFRGRAVMVIGQERGTSTETRLKHNFGMPRPEGYRKAQRLMHMAQQFNLPLLTFVDTPGAFPGIDAEERGQAEAIARSIAVSLELSVPIISIVIGEGGSGGAVAIATANSVMMLEHSIYSVISPEGCASILWRSASESQQAAEALKLTAQDLLALGVIDRIIPEPLGGAHRAPLHTQEAVSAAIAESLTSLSLLDAKAIVKHRQQKFLAMGSKGLN